MSNTNIRFDARRLIVIALAGLPMAVQAQEFNLTTTFASQAVALEVTPWQGEPVGWAQTGVISPQGGERQSSLRETSGTAGVDAHLLYAVTSASGSQTRSQASLNSLDIKIGPHEVTALWIEAEATATSGFLNVPTNGKTTIQGLVVDGRPVTITGTPNQTIYFRDGFLVINEQTGWGNQWMGTLTVNGLHLLVDGAGSAVAASATVEVITAPTR
jgi:hypothetical protein